MKFSQMESRFICKYLKNQYSLSISDTLEFWRFSPEDVRDYILDTFDMNISVAEIMKAARV
jgi:hypothetical protein